MPELPEVETVRRGLLPAMEGQRILQAELRRDGLRWPFPADMAKRLSGAGITNLRRRSKYILIDLDTRESLIIHLGMSGRMVISGLKATHVPGQFHFEHPTIGKHDHVLFHMANGARVTFNDPRRFGAMDLCATSALDAHPLLANIGPEPLSNAFHADYLANRLKGRKTPIKAALLDQRIVAGLGNIYVCEALFRAGISPLRAAGRIGAGRIERLTDTIRATLRDAIEAGGSSLRDYRQADGELGYFQHSFRVYGREGAPCVTQGCPQTIRRIVQSGRSSFYCSTCQR
ncbi:bifunctional DNA-formamidopyrimidine glycosylase/DNA-(apurinic or apyrimidinic site) lyase [Roseinatronobacter bogoriensis]|uniref:Formamidopyrimidine-DNA glycosylase n=1 Tax=Roseinatronobacter bogoriensis subsp. barguzinensis TaxID=441209 RepID=A0A2K8KDS5_9RHOB|nr:MULTISPECIES: bifunctional DNA-formamidopyrimidine glycosylase/DNA-(apurinic or apyrimidinic site) lyase [Rhodobaca]ATX67581.1 bifunctional DNA-formamidopyrimidine glycosylase/DNA-(apurinic or apyrimidinic site) lyase [Rhodobaca barguzinensis]MBB4209111.1 formamidopyrimidine-DNA glycosylase [Rhodobaca bogoriensis DSM 18756]TDW36361.1 DNA-(apurinic or apyrimidinic site) lyase [Rhodobaca barguzinensis]TDY67511.1 DNA-(apurinic or apyrimidinic site) lyase [Rhodobaca bogoriensis DSM 18756]